MRVLVTGGSGFIGTNLIDELLVRGIFVVNLDICPPKIGSHERNWQSCDILDFERTSRIFREFKPSHVIHLAARTDTISQRLEDYRVNIDGAQNVLRCIQMTPRVQRVIMTSSQFAVGPPGLPAHDEDYDPVGAYGLSKVKMEQATRSAGLNCVWTIIRPTNIWGPWHPRYPNEFWLVLKKGLYFHPAGKTTIRSYGYVKNVVFQIIKILEAEPSLVHQKVYYVGDPVIPLFDWANGFSLAITGRPVRMIPSFLLALLATAGSGLSAMGIRFPITQTRYRSMTEDYFSPIDTTIKTFGPSPYSLQEGIQDTVTWLKSYWSAFE